jgi:hypothetical protein
MMMAEDSEAHRDLIRAISARLDDGVASRRVDDLAERLAAVDDSLAPLVAAWLDGADADDERLAAVLVEGSSVRSLTDRYSMTVPAAIVTLDWLLRDPDTAAAALARGVDRVGARPLER